MPEQTRDDLVISYLRVRQALGWLGVGFPLVLIFGGLLAESRILPSISDYYHSIMRDIFVGCLFAIGVFLISYRGHPLKDGERFSDDFVATLAGLSAFGVALFPNEGGGRDQTETLSQQLMGFDWAATGHYISAVIFLGTLAYFCLVKFARTAKPMRRRIYLACGWFIVGGGVLATVASLVKLKGPAGWSQAITDIRLIFWIEAFGILAFGISWLVKGRAQFDLIKGLLSKRAKP